ncbi:hypothetical protein SAMN06265348_113221 [Pedobacter westerhofensis]|uniref:Uncharacterized protein n=1 Tax=Pedobacter westerhofensis TaxID=425512 RepID=A0A521FLF0_9SPHI|nr:hypothetical protein [Pedobacter westerhofensis]SMO97038.1 hypothetical protein SAMN06265348_113221 [Pedobacter westerhofensis]
MKTEIKGMSDDGKDRELVKIQIQECIQQIKTTAIVIQQIEDKQARDDFKMRGEKLFLDD